jgi:hypothetical protein
MQNALDTHAYRRLDAPAQFDSAKPYRHRIIHDALASLDSADQSFPNGLSQREAASFSNLTAQAKHIAATNPGVPTRNEIFAPAPKRDRVGDSKH